MLRKSLNTSIKAPVGFTKIGRYSAVGSSEVLSFSHRRRIFMSVYYSKKRKRYRYEFIVKGIRYTGTWYKLKTEARDAEGKRKEEIKNPKQEMMIPTDINFLTLVNKRLDYIETHNSKNHYSDYRYNARRWVKKWGQLMCGEITRDMIQSHINERLKVSPGTANQDLRNLRATFNFGKKMDYITCNPTQGIDFFPVEVKAKYIPSTDDIDRVISFATPDTQDYLWTIRDTFARVSEVNRLTWDDVNLAEKTVVLRTRKKKGGNLTPRTVPMTNKLCEIMSQRYSRRDESKPWVFWHEYLSRKTGEIVAGPYQDRKLIMKNLCNKAGVKYFRFHPLRHAGASLMDNNNVPLAAIQKILGHENRTTTEIYLHSSKNIERQAMEIYENAR